MAFCRIKVLPVSRQILNGERSSFVINGTDPCVGISALCISITRLVKIRKRKYTKFLKKKKILFYFTFWETQQSMTDKPSLLLRSPPTWCQKKKQHTDRRWFVSSKIFECAFSQLNIISNTNTTNLLWGEGGKTILQQNWLYSSLPWYLLPLSPLWCKHCALFFFFFFERKKCIPFISNAAFSLFEPRECSQKM